MSVLQPNCNCIILVIFATLSEEVLMKVKYVFHSCFVVEDEQVVVVYDYWQDNAEGDLHRMIAGTHKQVYFVVSHFHDDHYNEEILHWHDLGSGPYQPRVIVSYDTARRRHIPSSLTAAVLRPMACGRVEAHPLYTDELITIRAFPSTDVGMSTVTVLSDGTTLYHAGDNNNWYFEPGDERVKVTPHDMECRYLSAVRMVAEEYPAIDHVMFPLDPHLGSQTLRGARQWLQQISTRNFYPMHYWTDCETTRRNIELLRAEFPDTNFCYDGER